jgi:ankyrin repeat protein
MLEFVDPSMLSGREGAPLQGGETRATPLHHLADLADPFAYSTHEKQLILARQLIEHGANVNAVSIPQDRTPLYNTCTGGNVTNLEFVQLLLKEGADPNAQDHLGMTPLMLTAPCAPGAAKFLLNWPTTDATITNRSGASFLTRVRKAVTDISDKVALPDNPNRVQHQFLLQHWRGIKEILGKRDARDTGITAIE